MTQSTQDQFRSEMGEGWQRCGGKTCSSLHQQRVPQCLLRPRGRPQLQSELGPRQMLQDPSTPTENSASGLGASDEFSSSLEGKLMLDVAIWRKAPKISSEPAWGSEMGESWNRSGLNHEVTSSHFAATSTSWVKINMFKISSVSVKSMSSPDGIFNKLNFFFREHLVPGGQGNGRFFAPALRLRLTSPLMPESMEENLVK